jgi:protein-tyrosine phosphatase
MARQAVADGIRTIVATPHTLNGLFTNRFPDVAGAVEHLKRAFHDSRLSIDLYPGSDAHIGPNMVEKIRSGEAGTINGNGKYILIELPHLSIPEGVKEEIFQMVVNGITPIITHPERNTVIQKKVDRLYEFIDAGCLAQITAMGITGGFGKRAMAVAHKMLALRLCHVIASDAHNTDTRPPALSPAVEIAADVLGSRTEAEEMVDQRPRAILDGKSLQLPEPRRRIRRRWWFGSGIK